jgi:hypothetical protein
VKVQRLLFFGGFSAAFFGDGGGGGDMNRVWALLSLMVLAGCGIGGGRDNVVNGDHNLLVSDDAVDRVAARLAELASTPRVTDAELAALYRMVREGAAAGDLRATLVILEVARHQRDAAATQATSDG